MSTPDPRIADERDRYRRALADIELITMDSGKQTARGHLKAEYVGRIQEIIRVARGKGER